MPFNYDTDYSDTPDADTPAWVVESLTLGDVAAIQRGGCASGAYMPAVTYHKAIETMGEHGDDVLDYITSNLGELPPPPSDVSWPGMACHYLSIAVELWADGINVDDIIESSRNGAH